MQSSDSRKAITAIEFFRTPPDAPPVPTMQKELSGGHASRSANKETIRGYADRVILDEPLHIQPSESTNRYDHESGDWQTVTTDRESLGLESRAALRYDETGDDSFNPPLTTTQQMPVFPSSFNYSDNRDPFITSVLNSPSNISVQTNRSARTMHGPPAIDYESKSKLIVRTQPGSPGMPLMKHDFVNPNGFAYPNNPDDPGWREAVAYARKCVMEDRAEEDEMVESAPPEQKDAARGKAKERAKKHTRKHLSRILQRQSIYGWTLKKPLEKLTDVEHEMYCETMLAGVDEATKACKEIFFEQKEEERQAAKRLRRVIAAGEKGQETGTTDASAVTTLKPFWTPPLRMGSIGVSSPLGNKKSPSMTAHLDKRLQAVKLAEANSRDNSKIQTPTSQGEEGCIQASSVTKQQPASHDQDATPEASPLATQTSAPHDGKASPDGSLSTQQHAAQYVEQSLNPRFSIRLGTFGAKTAQYLSERGSPISPVEAREHRHTGHIGSPTPVAQEFTNSARSSAYSESPDGLPTIQTTTPVMEARPHPTVLKAGPTGSFIPSRRDTFHRRLNAERAKKIGKVGVHPAFSSGEPSPLSPTRVAMPPFSAQEIERIGCMGEGEKVRARLESLRVASNSGSPVSPQQAFFTAPLTQGEWAPRTPTAAANDERKVSIDEVTKLWEKVPTRSPFEQMLDAVNNDFRVEMGLDPIALGEDGGQHPNHPFPWNTNALKCSDRHSKGSSDESETCSGCGVFCCLYAQVSATCILSGEDASDDLAAELERKKMVQIERELPKGDMQSVLLSCSDCESLWCPDCCTSGPSGAVICHGCNSCDTASMI